MEHNGPDEPVQSQADTVSPDSVQKAAFVEGFLARHAPFTLVQRLGAIVLGIVYLMLGVGGIVAGARAIVHSHQTHAFRPLIATTPIFTLAAGGGLYLGAKTLWNALGRW